MDDRNRVTRPNYERFDMTVEESMAFWRVIFHEYDLRFIRQYSILLNNNNPQHSEDRHDV